MICYAFSYNEFAHFQRWMIKIAILLTLPQLGVCYFFIFFYYSFKVYLIPTVTYII